FAVIDLVAAVGLWLSAPWGAVVWLTSSVSSIVVEVFFPQIYDDLILVLLVEPALIIAYLVLAVMAARQQAPQVHATNGRSAWRRSGSSGSAIWVCPWRSTSSRRAIASPATMSSDRRSISLRQPMAQAPNRLLRPAGAPT